MVSPLASGSSIITHRGADWSGAPRPELPTLRDLAIAAGLAELFALLTAA